MSLGKTNHALQLSGSGRDAFVGGPHVLPDGAHSNVAIYEFLSGVLGVAGALARFLGGRASAVLRNSRKDVFPELRVPMTRMLVLGLAHG